VLVKFFDPHPGFGGAVIALPSDIKAIIDAFDGKKAELADILLALGKVPKAACWANLEHCYISCRIVNNGYTHQWRLIRWTDVTDDANVD